MFEADFRFFGIICLFQNKRVPYSRLFLRPIRAMQVLNGERESATMRPRYLLGVAVIWGAVGTLTAPTAQAATPNSPKFVNLILKKETKAINADTKSLNTRDKQIAQLETTTNPKKTKQLENSLTKLHNQILKMTTMLQSESVQVFTAASVLNPPNPSLQSAALSNLLLVQMLSVRAGLGVAPATPMQ
jgi:hypothetical protein